MNGIFHSYVSFELASQTGDASHVAAAAALDDDTDILVISPEKKEETSEIVIYFKSVTQHAEVYLEQERVRFIALDSTSQDEQTRHVALYDMMVDGLNGKSVNLKKLVDWSDDKVRDLLSQDQTKVRGYSILQYPPLS